MNEMNTIAVLSVSLAARSIASLCTVSPVFLSICLRMKTNKHSKNDSVKTDKKKAFLKAAEPAVVVKCKQIKYFVSQKEEKKGKRDFMLHYQCNMDTHLD